jgi:four helix bundle protein
MLKANESAKKNVVQEKSYAFALKIIELCKMLHERNEYVLAGQLLRAGTSIGANVEEATAAQTKKDFTAKMAVASKARETNYWLRLLRDSGNYTTTDLLSVINESGELIKILTPIVKTSQSTVV